MVWVTYEEFNGYNWEVRIASCNTYQYEALKRSPNIVIIKTEKINIVSY